MAKYGRLRRLFSLPIVARTVSYLSISNICTIFDHILTNAGWKISQKGVINVGLSDHQLIDCTRKILKTKANMHNQIWVQSLKN